MALAAEVLEMLIHNGGWVISGDSYEGIQFLECEPITEAEFKLGFAKCDAHKLELEQAKQAKKAAAEAKLAALGLDADDLKALGLA